ncbi:hypothetical protein KUTeg_024354 [Tegillarca granosa]|uniref:Heat shock 70 kDa protein 12B n=1 Tax=Tegillarca granosa TaxID=220873 RepID=A0ABQ9E3E9_TEGGR|nr:hypothetical protein KUTeg_024354 [Tegillarca granosa]
MADKGKLIVAAIDFGTTYSGYAFSFRHEYEKDRMNIFANTAWTASGVGLMSWKTPTTLLLDKDQVISRDVTIPDIEGKHMPARTVFSLSIYYLKEHLMKTLEKRSCGITMDDILWAGIESENLILALEPEAASLYCKYLQTKKTQTAENKTEMVPFEPGTRYLEEQLMSPFMR